MGADACLKGYPMFPLTNDVSHDLKVKLSLITMNWRNVGWMETRSKICICSRYTLKFGKAPSFSAIICIHNVLFISLDFMSCIRNGLYVMFVKEDSLRGIFLFVLQICFLFPELFFLCSRICIFSLGAFQLSKILASIKRIIHMQAPLTYWGMRISPKKKMAE